MYMVKTEGLQLKLGLEKDTDTIKFTHNNYARSNLVTFESCMQAIRDNGERGARYALLVLLYWLKKDSPDVSFFYKMFNLGLDNPNRDKIVTHILKQQPSDRLDLQDLCLQHCGYFKTTNAWHVQSMQKMFAAVSSPPYSLLHPLTDESKVIENLSDAVMLDNLSDEDKNMLRWKLEFSKDQATSHTKLKTFLQRTLAACLAENCLNTDHDVSFVETRADFVLF